MLSASPTLYLANVGVPLFTQSLFYQGLLLIPIMAIEAYAYWRWLGISRWQAVRVSFGANLISTFVGGLLIALPLGIWLGQLWFGNTAPIRGGAFPLMPIEFILTLIPLFFLSFFLEFWVARFRLKGLSKGRLLRACLAANGVSYLLLLTLALTQLVRGYLR